MEAKIGRGGHVLQEARTLEPGDRIEIYSRSHGEFKLLASGAIQIRAIKETEQSGNPAVLTTPRGSIGGGTLVEKIF